MKARETSVQLAGLPDALTVKETAAALRLSLNATYEAVRHGAIPAVRFGRAIRIPKAAIIELLETGGRGAGR